MSRFAALFAAIDQTNSTNAKVEAMVRYFVDRAAGGRARGRCSSSPAAGSSG